MYISVYCKVLGETFKSILTQSTDLFNGQLKYCLKIYTFDLFLNLPYIAIYITTMVFVLNIFFSSFYILIKCFKK